MRTATAHDAIEAVAHAHRGGHRCQDGNWYNDNAGTREQCAVRRHLKVAADELRVLGQVVHEAAHDDDAVDAVTAAMLSTPMSQLAALDSTVLEPWRQMTRLAIEGLSEYLDTDTSPEGRRADAAAALIRERAGLPPRT